jgi:hypothetical protein
LALQSYITANWKSATQDYESLISAPEIFVTIPDLIKTIKVDLKIKCGETDMASPT